MKNREPKQTETATIKPEWIRITQAKTIFGIGRTQLYALIADGKIKSASLKKRGCIRGTRLVSYDSLAAYIESKIVS